MAFHDLTLHADLSRLVLDDVYAKSKNIMVKKQNELFVLKYNKYGLNAENVNTLGLFRSIITDGTSLLSFSPPKSINFEFFKGEFKKEDCIPEQFIEGTMVNCFHYKNEWMIATRWDIGAKSSFYQDLNITFRDMFIDAMNACRVTFAMFDKNYSYSFVLQHPKNRIVVPFTEPHLFLIAKYEMTKQWGAQEIVCTDSFPESKVSIPMRYENVDEHSWGDLIDPYTSINTPYTVLGIMLKHPTGIRSKIRNANYEKVRHLKGNAPKIQFQYYNLYQKGRVKEFLQYYPEYNQTFWKFRTELTQWTKELFLFYKSIYIQKTADYKTIPYTFRPHVSALHKIYCFDLRPVKKYVDKQIVIKYVNNLPPQRLMYSINYPVRQKEKDDVKVREANNIM